MKKEQCPSYCFNVNSVQVLFIESEQCSSTFKDRAMVYKPMCSNARVAQGPKSQKHNAICVVYAIVERGDISLVSR